jgi:hypothetical protein
MHQHDIDSELAQALVKLAKAATNMYGAPEPEEVILLCRGDHQHMNEEEQLEALYGPAAPYSDHKIGETIRWFDLETRQERQAKILYVCAAGEVRGRQLPVRYVVDVPGFPSIVYHGEVIEE